MKSIVTAIAAALSLALALGGCAATSSTPSSASQVYAAKNAYEAALVVAVQYNNLPRCGKPTSPPICSEQSGIDAIRKANTAARTALDAAEKTVRDPAASASATAAASLAATNAVTAMQSILTLYSQKVN
jgi:hypothetical protein